MSRTVAAPVATCYDCGHAAHMHRERREDGNGYVHDAPSCIGEGPGYACDCIRTHQGINRAAGQIRSLQQAAYRRLALALTAGLMLAVGSALGSILASNALAEQNRRDTNTAVCDLLSYGASTEADKLEAYRRVPPPTPAGQAQMKQVERSLEKYRNRERALGCPGAKE